MCEATLLRSLAGQTSKLRPQCTVWLYDIFGMITQQGLSPSGRRALLHGKAYLYAGQDTEYGSPRFPSTQTVQVDSFHISFLSVVQQVGPNLHSHACDLQQ